MENFTKAKIFVFLTKLIRLMKIDFSNQKAFHAFPTLSSITPG